MRREFFRATYRLLCRDGEYHWARHSGTPVWRDGTFVGFQGTITIPGELAIDKPACVPGTLWSAAETSIESPPKGRKP
jgi:PAS fold